MPGTSEPMSPPEPLDMGTTATPVHEAKRSTDVTAAAHSPHLPFCSVEHRAWPAVGCSLNMAPRVRMALGRPCGRSTSVCGAKAGQWDLGVVSWSEPRVMRPQTAPLPPTGCPRSASRTTVPTSATWASMTVPQEKRWSWHRATSSSTSWVSARLPALASQ